MTGHTQSRVATPALIGTSLLAKKSGEKHYIVVVVCNVTTFLYFYILAIVEDLFHKLDTDNKGYRLSCYRVCIILLLCSMSGLFNGMVSFLCGWIKVVILTTNSINK